MSDDGRYWISDGEEWLREEAERQHIFSTFWDRFTTLCVARNRGRLTRRVAFTTSCCGWDETNMLFDLALFDFGFKNGLMDNLEHVSIKIHPSFPTGFLLEMSERIGKIPRLYKLEISTPCKKNLNYSPLSVQALSKIFEHARDLRRFSVNAFLVGSEDDFVRWSYALRNSSSLESMCCRESRRDVVATKSERPTRVSRKWDPVLNVIATNNEKSLTELTVLCSEEQGTALTVETSRQLVQLIRMDCWLNIEQFTLGLSTMDDVVTYCGNFPGSLVTDSTTLKFNFFAEVFQNEFLCDFMEKNGILLPSVAFVVDLNDHFSRLEDNLEILNVNVFLEKHLVVELKRIHTLISANLSHDPDLWIGNMIVKNEMDLFIYSSILRQDLLDFDPDNATSEKWTRMLSVFGNLCRGPRLGILEYNLNPLHSLVSKHLERVVQMGTLTEKKSEATKVIAAVSTVDN